MKKETMRYYFVFWALLGALTLQAQETGRANTGDVLLLKAGYAYQLPAADLSQRFGSSFSINSGFDLITKEKNWIYGVEAHLFFGSQVKEDVLVNLRTEQNFIIGNDRNPADTPLRERGYYLGGHVGKLFTIGEQNPRSGLRVTLGGGWLIHRIRLQEDPVRAVAPLNDEYRYGYDRLTEGLALRQFIGYQILDLKGQINFYGGIELMEGLTKGRRDIQFDTRQPYLDSRFDMLIGFRLAWTLPFYLNRNTEEIYY